MPGQPDYFALAAGLVRRDQASLSVPEGSLTEDGRLPLLAREKLERTGVSFLVQDAIRRHVEEGDVTGDFVRSLLENDLAQAVARADEQSFGALRGLVNWLHWCVPARCHGSAEKVSAWKREVRERREKEAAEAAGRS